MPGINDQQIAVLNGLISVTLDSANGYAQAALDTTSTRIRSVFGARATTRRSLGSALQARVHSLGGKFASPGSEPAATPPLFLNLAAVITSSDERVLKEAETEEDHLKAKYESALRDACLSAHVKAMVTNAYNNVKEDGGD